MSFREAVFSGCVIAIGFQCSDLSGLDKYAVGVLVTAVFALAWCALHTETGE